MWDWKKLDLCTDVIAESTKKVREVSLYSSGNNAVLMGWASADGLVNVKRFPRFVTKEDFWTSAPSLTTGCSSNVLISSSVRYGLESSCSHHEANVTIIQGQENSERLHGYIEDFKSRVRSAGKESNQDLKIVSVLDNNDVSYASEFQTSEGNLQP